MQFSGPSRKHPRTNNFTVLQTLLQADGFLGSRNSWRIRTLWTTMSQLLILLSSMRTQTRIHSFTHSHKHPSTHSSFHPPTLLLILSWPKPIYAALYQLPSFYLSDSNCLSAPYQPTANKDVPESNKWLMPDAATQCYRFSLLGRLTTLHQTSRSIATDQVTCAHNHSGHSCLCVCVSLVQANFNVWYASACKMCCTSGALLIPPRASRFTQTKATALV
jgi:hypothetical protein